MFREGILQLARKRSRLAETWETWRQSERRGDGRERAGRAINLEISCRTLSTQLSVPCVRCCCYRRFIFLADVFGCHQGSSLCSFAHRISGPKGGRCTRFWPANQTHFLIRLTLERIRTLEHDIFRRPVTLVGGGVSYFFFPPFNQKKEEENRGVALSTPLIQRPKINDAIDPQQRLRTVCHPPAARGATLLYQK